LEIISHRMFMSKLLISKHNECALLFKRLLVDLLEFMQPYLRNAELTDSIRLMYKGTLRVLLVLLHDFPEFLCEFHFSFCDVIPPSCIQMRNLILSAFPRNMRLPDPFTPNLKVDLLPEITQVPRILSDVTASLVQHRAQIQQPLDAYLKNRGPASFHKQLLALLQLPPGPNGPSPEAIKAGTHYNVPLINSLVLYVGTQGINMLQVQRKSGMAAQFHDNACMDLFEALVLGLDAEGRYYVLNAIANQLRYPNNHTHYFSCVLLYLFLQSKKEIIMEQITRVLLERLIVHRPHPWGLLITRTLATSSGNSHLLTVRLRLSACLSP
jgi:CCR4-NOT transcription complex subunit 1